MTTLEDVIVQLQTNSDNTVAATEASTESIVGSFQSNFTTLIDTIRGDSLDKLEATREANRAARQGAPGAGGLLAGAGAGAGVEEESFLTFVWAGVAVEVCGSGGVVLSELRPLVAHSCLQVLQKKEWFGCVGT